MPDFPARGAFGKANIALSNYGDTMLGDYFRGTVAVHSSNVWTTANTAIYCPFTINWPFLAQKMAVQVQTQSGNMDVGIYDERGARLVSMGSTAVAAAGLQVFNIADTWLPSGTYFMAMNVDNTTAAFASQPTVGLAVQMGRAVGLQIQAVGAVALPNPATFAVYTIRNMPNITVVGNAQL